MNGRYRILTATSAEERARKIKDQEQCGYTLKGEWPGVGKTIMLFAEKPR